MFTRYILASAIGPYLLYWAITAALSYLIWQLTKPKPEDLPVDDTTIDPSIRGSILPYLLGRYSTFPVVGWVGNTWAQEVEIDTGGKGSSDKPKNTVFWQSGMHMLCLGKGRELYSIQERGTKIFDELITPTSHPSGTSVDTVSGTFRIYWGEADQLEDTELTAYTGVSCKYNNVMYVMWDQKTLGSQRVWPMLEYGISVEPQASTLFSQPTWIDKLHDLVTYSVTIGVGVMYIKNFTPDGEETVSMPGYVSIISTNSAVLNIPYGSFLTFTYSGTTFISRVVQVGESLITPGDYLIRTQEPVPPFFDGQTMTASVYAYDRVGVNPIAAIHQYLFSPFPFGLGYDQSDYNLTDMEAAFNLFKDGGALECPTTIMLRNKKSIQDGIGMIQQDCGIMMPWDISTGQFRFIVLQSSDSVTAVTEGTYRFAKGSEHIETGYNVLQPEIRTYSFRDSARKFEQSTIMIADDRAAFYAELPNSKNVNLNVITDFATAGTFVARRDNEFLVRSGFKLQMSSTEMDMSIGDTYSFPNFTGNFLLVKKELTSLKAYWKGTFLENKFSVTSQAITIDPRYVGEKSVEAAFPDAMFRVVETNRYFTPDQDGVYLFRIRGAKNSSDTALSLSSDDTTYTSVALTSRYATGGILKTALAADTDIFVDNGPTLTLYGFDASIVQNLTGDDFSWKAGTQLMVINDEVFFLKKITATATDNEFTLDGLIRARKGTIAGSHSIGDEVYISLASDMILVQHSMLLAGMTLYGKSVPFTSNQSVDISDVTADSLSYDGGGNRPLACVNLNTDILVKAWLAGTDIDLIWDYRNIQGNAGAGLAVADNPYVAPPPLGYFQLEFLAGTVIQATVDVVTNSYTYTNAALVADFGSEPSTFNIKVYNVFGGLRSDPFQITLNRE